MWQPRSFKRSCKFNGGSTKLFRCLKFRTQCETAPIQGQIYPLTERLMARQLWPQYSLSIVPTVVVHMLLSNKPGTTTKLWHLKNPLVIYLILSVTTEWNYCGIRTNKVLQSKTELSKEQKCATTAVMKHKAYSSSICRGFYRVSLPQNWAVYYISQHPVIFHERRTVESHLLDLLYEWDKEHTFYFGYKLLRCANLYCLGKVVLLEFSSCEYEVFSSLRRTLMAANNTGLL